MLDSALECACGVLLSLATYVSVEGAALAFAALEVLLAPLAEDARDVVSLETNGSVVGYIALCFFPFQLREVGVKAVLLPLYVLPLYFLFVIIGPCMHLMLCYSGCVKSVDAQRAGTLTAFQVSRTLCVSLVLEAGVWHTQRSISEILSEDIFVIDGFWFSVGKFWSALFVLTIIPALTMALYCMEPGNPQDESFGSDENELPCDEGYMSKPKELFGLVGLLVGGTYARTARLYLESVVVFGLSVSLWKWLEERLTLLGCPELLSTCALLGVVFYVVTFGLRVVGGLYEGMLQLCREVQNPSPLPQARLADYV